MNIRTQEILLGEKLEFGDESFENSNLEDDNKSIKRKKVKKVTNNLKKSKSEELILHFLKIKIK